MIQLSPVEIEWKGFFCSKRKKLVAKALFSTKELAYSILSKKIIFLVTLTAETIDWILGSS